jgi:chromosome segregation ATPase
VNAIEAIKAAQAEAKLKARADLLVMADAIAKGEPAPADALRILSDAGQTTDALERLVAISRERLSLEPRAAAFKKILIERGQADGDLNAAVAAAEAELRAVNEKVEKALAPLRKRVADLMEAERDSRYAKQRLETLAADLAKAGVESGPITSAGMDRVRTAPRVTTTDED